MRNLFVMHTQYNLILSAGVISRSKEDHNTLVLWSEFSISKEILEALDRIFDRVIVVNDRYIKLRKPLEEVKFIRSCLKNVKCLKKERFDRIYMSQERIFDKILCEQVKRKNRNAVCIDIEEDAYYSVNNKFNDDGYAHIDTFRDKIRRALRAVLLFGHPYNYKESVYFYGMSKDYDEVMLLFPKLARRELSGQKLTEITREELLNGIEAIYSNIKTVYPESDRYMVMFFDLMNRYKNPSIVKELVRKTVQECNARGITVLMKYHPRETEKFSELGDAFELDKLIPAEKVLYDLREREVTVLGNATTSCIVAAKLGFRVNSICRMEAPDNKRMQYVMTQMGINCINDINNFEGE